ncbi:MAG TPA: hypothetical protein VNO33_22620 [Kofleriaceae bacterium]|nr:hypothetical protein [Kofleriaceae bacterium]
MSRETRAMVAQLAMALPIIALAVAGCSRQEKKSEQPPAAGSEPPAVAEPAPGESGADLPATPVTPEPSLPEPQPPDPEPQPDRPAPAEPSSPRSSEEPREPGKTEPDRTDPGKSGKPSKTASGPGQGEPCANGQCAKGLSCVEYYGIAGPRGPKMTSCEIRCPGGKGCPSGQQCATIADGPGQVCRPAH